MTVVMTGDSITDCGRDRNDVSSLGGGYVSLVAQALASSHPTVRVLNTGVSGDRVIDLQARWDEDVIAHSPQVLTIMIGINDTWRRYDSDNPTTVEDYQAGYLDLVTRAQAAGVGQVLLIEPFLLPVREEQLQWREDLDPKIQAVRRVAEATGASYLATDGPLAQRASSVGAAALANDGVHPSGEGHQLLADLIVPWIRAAL